ncbi:MAG TPA: hypothetical protein VHP61_02060 [Acidobacteriota bacterium]|nr:hypothetical protein [Acidobacteriota bacterium]
MKRWEPGLIAVLPLIVLLLPACQKKGETSRPVGTKSLVAKSAASEIDPEKIAAVVGVRFRVLKTEALGQTTRNKFYWISLGDKVAGPKLEELAMAIVRETITARPQTYHSFAVHFFLESELKETCEASAPFARATYLPEGVRLKVGRASIEDYKDYRLTLTRLDNK